MSNTSVCFEIPSELYEQLVAYVEGHPNIDWNKLGTDALARWLQPTVHERQTADNADYKDDDLLRGGRGEIKVRKGKREITVEVGSLWSTPEGDLFMHYKHPAEDNQGNQFVISQTVTGLAIVEHIRHSSVGKLLLRLLSQYGCWSNDPKTWHESQLSLVKSLRRDTRLWADLTEDETLTRVKEFFAGHGVTA